MKVTTTTFRSALEREEVPFVSGSEDVPNVPEPRMRPGVFLKVAVMTTTATVALIGVAGILRALNASWGDVFTSLDGQGVPNYEWVVLNDTGCNNWETIALQQSEGKSYADCEAQCSANSQCWAFNFQAAPCGAPQGTLASNTCILFDAACEVGTNPCWSLSVRMAAKQSRDTCSVLSLQTSMADVAAPDFAFNESFVEFTDTESAAAYTCASWTATNVRGGLGVAVGDSSIRAIYPTIVGTPVCALILANLENDALIQTNCSQWAPVDIVSSTVKLLKQEVGRVCAVGDWYNQFAFFYDAVLSQQKEAFNQALEILEMKSSAYVSPPPSLTNSDSKGAWVGWVTGTLNIVGTVTAGLSWGAAYGAAILTTSLILGDTTNLLSDPDTGETALTWQAQQLFNEQVAAAESLNTDTLIVSQMTDVINGLLRFVLQIFGSQQKVIVMDAGRLASAAQIALLCRASTTDISSQVLDIYSAQLWRALILMMPSKYAIYFQRNMGVAGNIPPCFDSFAQPVPTHQAYSPLGQTLDWCDSQYVVGGVYSGFQNTQPSFSPDVCQPDSRQIWLAQKDVPAQLAPDQFWSALGNPVSGLLSSFIGKLYNVSIAPGAEGAWQAMLGQCKDLMRSYQPATTETFTLPESPTNWAWGLNSGGGTTGWIEVSSDAPADGRRRRRTTSSPSWSGMSTLSTLPSVCDVFGIRLSAYPLPDCAASSGIKAVKANTHNGINSASSDPTCINGWTAQTELETVAQLNSFNQNGLVPAGCPKEIEVRGAAFHNMAAMGIYAKLPEPMTHEQRPVYTNARLYVMYYNKSAEAWVVGASGLDQPGFTITSHLGADADRYLVDTPCPLLGLSSTDTPALQNVSVLLTSADLDASPPQVKTCCRPWGDPPADCTHAVCDCNALRGLQLTGMISVAQYNRWEGRCSACYKDGQGLYEPGGGIPTQVSGATYEVFNSCGTMTSAGPLALVLQGNINSPPPS